MDRFFGLDKVSAHDENCELLVTVNDNVALSVLRSILDGESIPYLIRERGSGRSVKIIAGYSMFGTDILVPKTMLDAATELLDAYRNGKIVDEDGLLSDEETDGVS